MVNLSEPLKSTAIAVMLEGNNQYELELAEITSGQQISIQPYMAGHTLSLRIGGISVPIQFIEPSTSQIQLLSSLIL